MTVTPDALRDPDRLPFAYDHVITAGDLHRVLNETLRPLLNAVSSRVGTVTTTAPLTVALDDGTTRTPTPISGFHPAVGSRVIVLFVPAVSVYYAVLTVT